ncbi:unnamed protein product [Linum tenue]|uniref:Uncharacterized protein n=1 Tax=Linum tenue TaxID=586396 RepID=A0AAV0LWM3_9ROSI|nr:unnamed protein product [Linum tenue]CAI0475526.1 unnamed protein product [Linum tenue]
MARELRRWRLDFWFWKLTDLGEVLLIHLSRLYPLFPIKLWTWILGI